MSTTHYHVDDSGLARACWHRCRPLLNWRFWAATTLSFPLEHSIWEKVPPFSFLTQWMGL